MIPRPGSVHETLVRKSTSRNYDRTMAERRFAILKYSGKTPLLATCELCHLKFFTPRETTKPDEAETYLREKFQWHECKVGLKTKPLRPI
jgi:hypothetical protein